MSGRETDEAVDAGSASERLLVARRAFAARAWRDAHAAFTAADADAELSIDDLEQMAVAAGLGGDEQAMLQGLERAHQRCLQAELPLRAARAAFWAGYRLMPLGEMARAQAWFARAQRLVDGSEQDCVERGYMLVPVMMRQLMEGNAAEAQANATRAIEIAERFGDADLSALSRVVRGRALLKQAQVERGLAELDDAMLAATSHELSPVVTGLVYCFVIGACAQVYALDRARQWTAALSHWCEPQPQLAGFAGTCMVHRAELMELGGSWSDALDEAKRAEARLSSRTDPRAAADAIYQQAEIQRLRGELTEAEASYGMASRLGRDPLPGLALLRLAQGSTDVAASAMRRAMATVREPLARARLLPAHVEIMLAADDLEQARGGRDELQRIADSYGTEVLRALCVQAHAAVLLAEDNAEDAVEPLREALSVWQRVGAPYLVARLHAQLGQACCRLGDAEGAQLEWSAARDGFTELGAAPDLVRLDVLQREPPRESARAPAPAATAPPSSGAPSDTHGLSARELEVLRLLATGKTNRVIARELCVSDKTIDRHVSNLFGKLGVSSRAAATAFAYEHGLVQTR
jgi:DNA-binding CsgD family transcriptional regulator/tetratricopeptide (TPR) repeat protein